MIVPPNSIVSSMTPDIDFDAINDAALRCARSLLPNLILNGKFRSLEYIAKNPRRNDQHAGSFSVNYKSGIWKDFATGDGGKDIISLVAYLRGTGQGEAARELADKLGVPALKASSVVPSKPNGTNGYHSRNGASQPIIDAPLASPKIYPWGDDGPPVQRNEIRRHAYRNDDGVTVRFKVKFSAKYVNWYRIFKDGASVGWQAKKPDDFAPGPYVTAALNPFDPELRGDPLLWPEGERDVDTLSRLNLPAFTFGGVGDGLPSGIEHYLSGRDLVILADNDDPGREHAEKKAAFAHGAGAASIRIVHFPELAPKGDISDFIATGSTAEQLYDRVSAAPLWKPSDTSAQSDNLAQSPPVNRGDDKYQLVMRCAADIAPEKIEWLWPGRLARGKHTCIAGEPGTGKSQVCISIIAAVTTGGEWPCGEGQAPLGNVIVLSAEDGAADTIIPRLLGAGADVKRVHVVSAVRDSHGNRRALNLQSDLDLLERKIAEIGNVALVVVDPVSSYLGKTDSHKNSEVRGVLEPLSEMAERARVAILSVTHFSKAGTNSTTKALHRFIGSIAFTGAPRAAFAVIEDAEHDGRRLFLHAKNNLACAPQGLAFQLEQCLVGDGIVASRILWDAEPVTITANEALAAEAAGTETRTAKAEATDFIQSVLAAGPVGAADVNRMARDHGLTTKAIRSAREALGVKIERDGFGPGSKSLWSLPEVA